MGSNWNGVESNGMGSNCRMIVESNGMGSNCRMMEWNLMEWDLIGICICMYGLGCPNRSSSHKP